MQKRFDLLKVAIGVAIAVLLLLTIYGAVRLWEAYQKADPNNVGASKTIVRDGVSYYPRQDITVFLIMGIDEFGPMTESTGFQNSGASDAVMLVIFDHKAEKMDVLSLNRDTMMDIPVLGVGGKPAGTYFGQLALAHTFGSGLEDSCENTKKAVSNFLYGLRIDYYMALNMNAIGILNDAVGGVEVTVTDDFSLVDPSIPMGTVRLSGQQALSFIRQRKDMPSQLNLSRMERQNHYMEQFAHAFQDSVQNSQTFITDTYEQITPYLVSDCSINTISSAMSRFSDYTFGKVITLKGENRQGERYMEFYVEEQNLDDTVLQLFYAPKA